jgi:hypothetical protein
MHVLTPPGSIIATRFPATSVRRQRPVSQRVADVCLRALAECGVGSGRKRACEQRAIGGSGWVYYETIGGGQGGSPAAPAWRVHTNMTNTDTRGGVRTRSFMQSGARDPAGAVVREFPVVTGSTVTRALGRAGALVTERRVGAGSLVGGSREQRGWLLTATVAGGATRRQGDGELRMATSSDPHPGGGGVGVA